MKRPVYVVFPATLLFGLYLAFFVSASPFRQPGTQKPFVHSQDPSVPPAVSLSRLPAVQSALKSLRDASPQVIETFEKVMAELGDISQSLTWMLPQKQVVPRPNDWDFTITTKALPEHSLRIKQPNELGVDDVRQYSGYLDVSDGKHFFFWFFESRNDPKKDPLVLWLNGGPGCSSLTGLFMELGPASVDPEGKNPVYNPHSWNNNASVIFLDQPINVGYSYGDETVSDTVAAGKDVYALLVLFFKQFPQYKHLDFHIAGESYAGHYIPVFASELLSHQSKESSFFTSDVDQKDLAEVAHINLKSLLIGNGLTDGKTQYSEYPSMACNNSYGPVLSPAECSSMEAAYPRCAQLIQSCYDNENVWSCVPASLYCNNAMIGPYARTGQKYVWRDAADFVLVSMMYARSAKIQAVNSNAGTNSRKSMLSDLGKHPNLSQQKGSYGGLSKFDMLRSQHALGAEVSSYESCNTNINRNFLFAGDWFKPYHLEVPKILDRGIPILIYAGDADYICNWMGNQAWTDALEWPGAKRFRDAHMRDFMVKSNGQVAGQYKSAEGLTFMRVYRAGHMVPYNQPENSLAIFNEWLAQSP